MSLEQDLAALKAEFSRTAPPGRAALYEAKIEELRTEFALGVRSMSTKLLQTLCFLISAENWLF